MMVNFPKLTLDTPVTYHIKIPGTFAEDRSEWNGGVRIMQEQDEHGHPFTVLVATVDQAALHSLLRRLYSMGIPLISIQLKSKCI
jgi:hypothetical protein